MAHPHPAWRLALRLALFALVCLGPATAVHAQMTDEGAAVQRPPGRQARASDGFGVRAFAAIDTSRMLASQTFEAVLGSSQLRATAVGGELTGLWRGVFVRVEGSTLKKTGSRVIVADGEVVPLGIPLTIEMQHVVLGAGWRVGIGRAHRAAWYLGGGIVHMVYRETSALATVGDNTDTTFDGRVAFGGVDVKVWRVFRAGGEVQVRSLPKTIGTGGASKAFGERDLGSVTVRAMVGVAF